MSKLILMPVSLFLLLLILVIYSEVVVFQGQTKELDQLDTLLATKTSVARAFTPEVEAQVMSFLDNSSFSYHQIHFHGSTTDPVEWGGEVRIYYDVEQTIVQKGLAFLGIDSLKHNPREFTVVAIGRGEVHGD